VPSHQGSREDGKRELEGWGEDSMGSPIWLMVLFGPKHGYQLIIWVKMGHGPNQSIYRHVMLQVCLDQREEDEEHLEIQSISTMIGSK
jgi:hypothetical protein